MFKPRKAGWRDLREGGGNCKKYLERKWNRKEWREHKDFKKGGQARPMALKRGRGDGTPLRTMYNQFLLLNNYRLWH